LFENQIFFKFSFYFKNDPYFHFIDDFEFVVLVQSLDQTVVDHWIHFEQPFVTDRFEEVFAFFQKVVGCVVRLDLGQKGRVGVVH
jgi:hypothetical protein